MSSPNGKVSTESQGGLQRQVAKWLRRRRCSCSTVRSRSRRRSHRAQIKASKHSAPCHLLSRHLFTQLNVRRRQFLATTGIAAATTLAGCSDSEDGSGGDGGGSEGNGSANSSNDSGNSSGGSNESGSSNDEALTSEEQESTVDGLEITEHELVEGDIGPVIQGVVLNDTGSELSYVEVGVVLYNADGQRINDSFTNTTDLPSGEEWAFEIILTDDMSEIDDYTIAVTDSPF